MTQLSTTNFTIWAKQASDGYVEDEVPMNDTIAKIAQENDLTPLQIQQVCKQANVMTYEQMFKSAEDKTFSFGLADAAKIVSGIKEEDDDDTGPSVADLDYMVAPPQQKVATDWGGVFGVTQVSNEPEVHEKVAKAKHLTETIKKAQEEIQGRLASQGEFIYEARQNLTHEVKQAVLDWDGNPLHALTKIAKAIHHSMDGDRRKVAISELCKVASDLAEQGALGARKGYILEKFAEAVQPGLISTEMNTGPEPEDQVQVVNGNHPIIMHVNQLVDQVSEEDRLKQGLLLLEDKAGYAISKIEDLNTSAKTDDYVQRQTTQDQPVWVNPDPWKRRFREGVGP